MIAARDTLRYRPERLLPLLLAAYALVSAWDFSLRPACIDYYQFWVVGRAVAAKETQDVYSGIERKRLGEVYWQRALDDASQRTHGAQDAPPNPARRPPPAATKLLQVAGQRRELETYSTPFFYTLFGIASLADYERSQNLFQCASLLGYVAAIALLARLLGFSLTATALFVAALLQWFNPFVDDVLAGNVNRLQLLALAVFLWIECRARFPARHAIAGAWLGALIAFKPNLAAVVLMLVLGWGFAGELSRLSRFLAGLAAGALAAVVASAAYFGALAPWYAWFGESARLLAPGSPIAGAANEGNYSLARWLRDNAGFTPGAALPGVLVLAGIGALVLERRRRAPGAAPARISREFLLVGLGAALSLLATELAWQHYFIAVVPLAMVLLRPAEEGAPARVTPRALALAALALVSLQNVGRLFDLHQPEAGAALVAGGTLLFFLVGIVDLATPRVA